VLVVDDSAAWRGVVAAQLQEWSAEVVGTAKDGLEAIDQAGTLRPDVVIMDITMPRLDGLAATRAICALAAPPAVIIVSNQHDPAIIQAALAAGARGYVLKSLAASDLRPAVEAARRGEVFVSRSDV